jgi:hypothetical protein
MSSVTLEEAQAKLPDIIHQLTTGEAIVITEGDQDPGRGNQGPALSIQLAAQLNRLLMPGVVTVDQGNECPGVDQEGVAGHGYLGPLGVP